MSSQSIVADLSSGDRVQIYLYTHTGAVFISISYPI
jgi:hypothetical protein